MKLKNIIEISRADFDYQTYCVRFFDRNIALLINVSGELLIEKLKLPDDFIIIGVKIITQYVVIFGFSNVFVEPVPEGTELNLPRHPEKSNLID